MEPNNYCQSPCLQEVKSYDQASELSYFGFGKQVTIRLVKIVFNTFSSPFSIFSENEDRKQPNQTPPKYLKAFKLQNYP